MTLSSLFGLVKRFRVLISGVVCISLIILMIVRPGGNLGIYGSLISMCLFYWFLLSDEREMSLRIQKRQAETLQNRKKLVGADLDVLNRLHEQKVAFIKEDIGDKVDLQAFNRTAQMTWDNAHYYLSGMIEAKLEELDNKVNT